MSTIMKYIRIFSFVLFLQLCSLASAQTFSAGAGLSLGVPAEDAVGYGIGVDISYDQTIVDFGSWKLSAVPEMIAGNYRIGVTGGFANDVFADFWLPALFRFAPDGDKRYFSPVAGPYAELVFDSLGLCKHFDAGISLGFFIPVSRLSLNLKYNISLLNGKDYSPRYYANRVIVSLVYPF